MTGLELMIILLFLSWLIKLLVEEKWSNISFSKYKWLIFLFLVVATISVFISDNRIAALGLWKAYFVEPILFFLVFINTIKKREQWNLIIWSIGASALLVAIPAMVQKFTGWGIANPFWRDEVTRRVVSWYGFPNAVGLYLGPITMLYVGMFWLQLTKLFNCYKTTKKIKLNWKIFFTAAVILLSGVSVFWAETEGALVGLFAGLVFLGLFYHNKKLRIITIASLVSLVALVTLVSPIKDYVFEKGTLSDRSGQIRQEQWRETGQMLNDGRTIFGAGLSNYQTAVAPYHQTGIYIRDNTPNFEEKINTDLAFRKKHWQPTEIYMYPHNIILNFWSELGLGGVLVMLALVIYFLWNYRSVKNQENKKVYLILIAVLIMILVHGLVDVPYFKNDLSVFWWLLFGLSILLLKNKKEIKI
jgi:O-antigen ligase